MSANDLGKKKSAKEKRGTNSLISLLYLLFSVLRDTISQTICTAAFGIFDSIVFEVHVFPNPTTPASRRVLQEIEAGISLLEVPIRECWAGFVMLDLDDSWTPIFTPERLS